MSYKGGKQKNYTDTDDFEAFVRESLVKLREGQERILHDVATLKEKVQLNKSSLNDISARLTKINQNYEEVKGELHDANCKIEEIESTMQNQAQQIQCEYNLHPGVSWGGLPSENRRYFN